MAEPPKKPDPPKTSDAQQKPGPTKKLEARPAGSANTREDVFKTFSPNYPDDGQPGDGSPYDEKITFEQALTWKDKAKRMSRQIFGTDKKKDDKTEEGGQK